MALEHAILVSLGERPGTGYELARRFSRSIGFFWDATHQQIYKVLRRMAEAGWVSFEEVVQEGRPDKKVYRVSDDGRAELTRWLAEPLEPTAERDALALKIRGAGFGDVGDVVEEVARERRRAAERLELFLAIERRDFPEPHTLTGRDLHQHLVLRGGVRGARNRVEWCDEVLAALCRDLATAPAAGQ